MNSNNTCGPYLRGIDSLIHETAKNEMLRDYHFSRVLAKKRKELSKLNESYCNGDSGYKT